MGGLYREKGDEPYMVWGLAERIWWMLEFWGYSGGRIGLGRLGVGLGLELGKMSKLLGIWRCVRKCFGEGIGTGFDRCSDLDKFGYGASIVFCLDRRNRLRIGQVRREAGCLEGALTESDAFFEVNTIINWGMKWKGNRKAVTRKVMGGKRSAQSAEVALAMGA